MKNRVSSLLLCCTAAVFLTVNAWASDGWKMSDDVYCGGEANGFNLSFGFDDGGKLVIYGEGIMANYPDNSETRPPWYAIRDQIVNVEIQDGVTSIGAWAFCDCPLLETVTIPASMKEIGQNSFAGCTGIQNVIYNGTEEQRQTMKIGSGNEALSLYSGLQEDEGDLSPDNTPVSGDADTTGDTNASGDADTSGDVDTSEDIDTSGKSDTAETADVLREAKFEAFAFGFANNRDEFAYAPSYSFPLERYQAVFGDNFLAQRLYETDGEAWSGNSFGMAAASILLFQQDSGLTAADFRSDALSNSELLPEDQCEALGVTLKEWIEELQICRKSPEACKSLWENRGNLAGLCGEAARFQETGKDPALVCVSRSGTGDGRFLTVYRFESVSEAECRLYVYDPMFPSEGSRFITVYQSEEGQYTGWSYAADSQTIWNSADGGGISWLPGSVCVSLWKNRGNPSLDYVLLTAGSEELDILDVLDKPVAAFRAGRLETERGDIWPLPRHTHSVSVWLPVDDVYTVKNENFASLTASLVNVEQDVSVTTDAASASLSVEDATVSGFVQIDQGERSYRTVLRSVLDPKLNDVRLEGKTKAEAVLSISRFGGVLSLSGADESAQLTINGEAVSKDAYQLPSLDDRKNEKNPFKDVKKTDYFYNAVLWAVGQGITNGTSADTFSPHNPCTRSHIITFLWRANGRPVPQLKENPFPDVSAGCYYEKAAIWAYENGLETGERFAGDTPCTRAAAVTYLWKLDGRPAGNGKGFADISYDDDSELSQATAWALEKGITKGTTDTTFSPETICTRAQIVTFLWRRYGQNSDVPMVGAEA